ncbi:MAG TPA: M48 family metallopeptidase [Flavobacterium sp.]|nr:M48 family metallopeptidase [Flavobacterium sp.]
MIKKTIFQGAVVIVSFVAIWLAFSQVDFMRLFHVDKVNNTTAEKLGDMIWESIERTETVITNDSVVKPIDKLITHIADKNGFDRKDIKLHIVEKDEVNAFALPGNHLVVYTGLIKDCDNESELAGVLGHEMAHIEKDHVMKKLVKEVGFSVLVSVATGGRGQQMAGQIAKTLSSSAYDRKLESEADIASVDYLIKADLDPEQFANFMFKMANDKTLPAEFYWISTHPESEERAKAIVEYIKGKRITKKEVLSAKDWESFKARVKENY